MSMLNIEDYLKNKHYILCKDTYANNGSLAVFLQENKNMLAVLTINIEASDCIGDETCAYVDTNNLSWVEQFLQENKIAQPTGEYGFSGFCAYPLYKFDITKLKEV